MVPRPTDIATKRLNRPTFAYHILTGFDESLNGIVPPE